MNKPKWAFTPGQLELLEEVGEVVLFLLQCSAVVLSLGIFIELLLAVPQAVQ